MHPRTPLGIRKHTDEPSSTFGQQILKRTRTNSVTHSNFMSNNELAKLKLPPKKLKDRYGAITFLIQFVPNDYFWPINIQGRIFAKYDIFKSASERKSITTSLDLLTQNFRFSFKCQCQEPSMF